MSVLSLQVLDHGSPKMLLLETGRNHNAGAAEADNCGLLSRDVVWSGCEFVVNGTAFP